MKRILLVMIVSALIMASNDRVYADLLLVLATEELVEANDIDIDVGTYSVPSFVDWDNDGLKDLVIGEKTPSNIGKVRVYLNVGTESDPQFSNFSYAQSNGSDLTCTAGPGCLGCFPRAVYWDADTRKDLLVGQYDGTVKIFLNTGTDESPTFDGGTTLQAGSPGSDIDVGDRATPCFINWNNDGKTDLVVGGLDGKVHIYLNCGCGGAVPPSFLTSQPSGSPAQENGGDLVVPSTRSSPDVLDLDGDGRKDLLTGNTDGQLLFYTNTGTNSEPNFSGYSFIESNGVPIDLPGTPRSRPVVCDWTGDNYLDVLIGASDGKVHLYQGLPLLGDFEPDGDVDFSDFAVFASAWQSMEGDYDWNPDCDISDPNDGIINELDLILFTENWLASVK